MAALNQLWKPPTTRWLLVLLYHIIISSNWYAIFSCIKSSQLWWSCQGRVGFFFHQLLLSAEHHHRVSVNAPLPSEVCLFWAKIIVRSSYSHWDIKLRENNSMQSEPVMTGILTQVIMIDETIATSVGWLKQDPKPTRVLQKTNLFVRIGNWTRGPRSMTQYTIH